MKRLFADIGFITGKDLKIELRSRVLTNQVAPFALMILVLFGIALDAVSYTHLTLPTNREV